VAFVWELTKETIDLTLGCLQGGRSCEGVGLLAVREGGDEDGGDGLTALPPVGGEESMGEVTPTPSALHPNPQP